MLMTYFEVWIEIYFLRGCKYQGDIKTHNSRETDNAMAKKAPRFSTPIKVVRTQSHQYENVVKL